MNSDEAKTAEILAAVIKRAEDLGVHPEAVCLDEDTVSILVRDEDGSLVKTTFSCTLDDIMSDRPLSLTEQEVSSEVIDD